MRRYPEHKASGVKWIGEIPVHWAMKRLKYLASLISKGTTPTTIGKEIFDEGEIRFIKGENIVDNQIELKPEYYIDEETNQMLKRSQLKEDDLLFVIAGTIGKIGLVRPNHLPANTNQAISFIRLHKKELPKFIYYWLQSDNIEKITWLEVVQSAQPNLSMENLGNLYIPYPNIAEQLAIIDFLDHKTGQIDELIHIKERRIELLQEQRTALINQAVTKGLDPTVEMKPSGVQWIGEIPRNWSIMKVKYLTHQIIDGTHYTPEYQDSGIPFLRVTDIHDKTIDLAKVKYITPELHQELTQRCKPEKGNLLLSKNGTIGITRVIDWDFEFSIFVSLCLIKFRTEIYSPHFFSYLFQSQVVDQQLKESSKTSTVTNLHLDKIRELFVVKPPLSEQAQIINSLDCKTQQIDELISTEQQKIELLKEYRQSLISEAVTGKIDVRNEA